MSRPEGGKADAKGTSNLESGHSYPLRETIESIVVAVLLAFLFRTFVGEAFIIPTGSMAPTLQGNHKDVTCVECGYPYQASASSENDDLSYQETVGATTCPLCRFTMPLDLDLDEERQRFGLPTDREESGRATKTDANHESFSGDRILVSKFSYDLSNPRRWDVIVFKYPNNAKQNYIKRLIGLPGETVRVRHGDVLIKPAGENDFRIARKPPHKLVGMLQAVHDTHYRSPELAEVGWPSRWQPGIGDGAAGWRTVADDEKLELPQADGESWLRYRHLIPSGDAWFKLLDGDKSVIPQPGPTGGQLISDFYAYNAFTTVRAERDHDSPVPTPSVLGTHWVGDLGLEAEVTTTGNTGELILELVEGGVHFQCRIDLATGEAKLVVVDERLQFVDDVGQAATASPKAATAVRGGRRHRLRFTNVDDELRLWVDDSLATFDGPTTYVSPEDCRPHWRPDDLGDLAPAGIATHGASAQIERLRILRDVYYVAVSAELRSDSEYTDGTSDLAAVQMFADPESWSTTNLFARRRSVDFPLGEDQFFPMGDNSPQSKDGRLWGDPPYVERELLTGKAVLVYWPHAWSGPFRLPIPNVSRMRLIR